MNKGQGWHGDSFRHALASKGIPTTTQCNGLTIGEVMDDFNLRKLYHLTASGLATEEPLKLSDELSETIEDLNEEGEYKYEWIADLDYKDQLYINDSVVSHKTDESELDWKDEISEEEEDRGEEADSDNCVGYIHYHPKSVDKRPTAQDFVLAFSIDKMRNEGNKEAFRPTTFGVVRDDHVRFFFLTPDEEQREEYGKRLNEIQESIKDKDTYFKKVEEEIDNMKDEDILHETKDIELRGDED